MSAINTKKVVNILSVLAIVFTAIQGMIPTMPMPDTTIVSAIVMFIVTGLTIWKQALSKEIDNNALIPTIIVAAIATIGGLNELLKVFHFTDVAGQWIRFVITSITAILNVLSKIIWPTPDTKTSI